MEKTFEFHELWWVQALGTDTHRLQSFNDAIAVKCIDDRRKPALLQAIR